MATGGVCWCPWQCHACPCPEGPALPTAVTPLAAEPGNSAQAEFGVMSRLPFSPRDLNPLLPTYGKTLKNSHATAEMISKTILGFYLNK